MRTMVWGLGFVLGLSGQGMAGDLWEDVATHGTIGCLAWTRGDNHLVHKAGFLCINAISGGATGALTNANGRVACRLDGYQYTDCLYIIGCRMDQVACR
jgi:hypothetical protein